MGARLSPSAKHLLIDAKPKSLCSPGRSASRGGSEHDALEEMVMAQGLGNADRQAARDEEGDRRADAQVGRDHAPHLG